MVRVTCSTAKADAVKQLEQFQGVMRAQLKRSEEHIKAGARMVPAASGEAAVETATTEVASAPGLRELNSETYWKFIREEAGDKLVVVDFYTDWCGPCKLMYPTLCKWNEELGPQGVVFVKLNCNASNKTIGKELGIKVAPTFHVYRNGERLHEMTGAKADKLKELIDQEMATVN